jgi:nitrogen fixation NifU-like protein
MSDAFEDKINDAIRNPQNMGEMTDADAVGTVGSPDCGDMVRMWLKFGEQDGKKVIDKASFQSFGCQTAIAVASMATELLKGKTIDEAKTLSAEELSQPLGPLPPMKIHCGQMVEGALRDALDEENKEPAPTSPQNAPTLIDQLQSPARPGKIKITKLD